MGVKKRKTKGRPELVIDPASYEEIRRMASLGMKFDHICFVLGVSPRAVRNKRKAIPELDAAFNRGRAQGEMFASGMLIEKIRAGNLGAIIFYLKSQHGWRENKALDKVQVDTKQSPSEYAEEVRNSLRMIDGCVRSEHEAQQQAEAVE